LIVVDASVLVAALTAADRNGTWAADQLADESLAAPASAPFEVANVLRRLEITGDIDRTAAALALEDLLDLPIDLFPFEVLARPLWRLRHNVTAYDGAYVALAEALGVPLVTLDRRLARAPGTTVAIRTPPPG